MGALLGRSFDLRDWSFDAVSRFNFHGSQPGEVEYVGLENFERTLSDPKFRKALSNTLYYVSGSVICIVPLGFFWRLDFFNYLESCVEWLLFAWLYQGWHCRGQCPNYLPLLSWKGRRIEPIPDHTFGNESDQLDDGPQFHYAFTYHASGLEMDRRGCPFFPLRIGRIPRWQFEAAKLEGMSSFSRVRHILIPGVRKLALFIVVFLTVDGVAAFSGAYTLLGGSGGMLDSGLLLVTYVYQVAFPGGSGRFDLPGAVSMSLMVAPIVAGFLFIVLKVRFWKASTWAELFHFHYFYAFWWLACILLHGCSFLPSRQTRKFTNQASCFLRRLREKLTRC